jgi:hypothetical protein
VFCSFAFPLFLSFIVYRPTSRLNTWFIFFLIRLHDQAFEVRGASINQRDKFYIAFDTEQHRDRTYLNVDVAAVTATIGLPKFSMLARTVAGCSIMAPFLLDCDSRSSMFLA